MTNNINIAHALHSLAPGATWKYTDEDYSTIVWINEEIPKPSQESIAAEILRLQKQYDDEQLAITQKENEKELAKKTALEKLSKMGLTEEEAKAIIGI